MNSSESSVDPRVAKFLRKELGDNADQAIKYLEEKGFQLNGQLVVGSIFVFAKNGGVSGDTVIAAAEKEWERSWKYQHPMIRSNVDAPGQAGLQNHVSMRKIYEEIGIPNPADK